VPANVSLKHVAARACVSFQTASKVLNGKGTVSATTRERILAAAADLGYVPNRVARSLVSRTTGMIGVIATDFSDTTLAQHVVGIEREARRRRQAVLIGSLDHVGSDAESYLTVLLQHRVEGIILVAPVVEDDQHLGELLRRSHVAVVSLHPIGGGGVSLVLADDPATGRLPARHLLELGHRHIGLITGDPARRVTRVRTRAFLQALEEAGVAWDDHRVEAGHWDVDSGHVAMHRLLDGAPELSAVVVQNDMMAVGALSALHERGRRVPDDCAVVGCDNLPISSRTVPPLTTVEIPFYEVGEAAVGLLDELLTDPATPPRQVVLPVGMVYRRSSDPSHADQPGGVG